MSEVTLEDVDRILTSAILQASDAQRCLWSALVDELLITGLVDHASLAAKISEFREHCSHRGGLFDSITCTAMRNLTEREFPNLEEAPEWVREMVAGKLVAKRPGVDGDADAVAVVRDGKFEKRK